MFNFRVSSTFVVDVSSREVGVEGGGSKIFEIGANLKRGHEDRSGGMEVSRMSQVRAEGVPKSPCSFKLAPRA